MSGVNIKFPTLIIILLAGILLGTQLDKLISRGGENEEQAEKISDVFTYAEEYFVREIDPDELSESAIKGMLEKLDPHSVYIPPVQQETVEEEFRGNFEGVGIEFQIIKDTITVVSPIIGGPSEKLGILSGDRIIKINGNSSVGFENSDVIKNLRGRKGTEVGISILRPSTGKILEFTITRDEIPIYSVESSFMYDNEVGYISLSRFAETTFDELETALEGLFSSGMKKLILDLRNNPGGLLNSGFQSSGYFYRWR